MTTRELMQLADMVGDMAAGLAFFSERAGNRHRDSLAKLRQQSWSIRPRILCLSYRHHQRLMRTSIWMSRSAAFSGRPHRRGAGRPQLPA